MKELVMTFTCPACKAQLRGDIIDLTENEEMKCCNRPMRLKIEFKENPTIEKKPYPTQERAKRA